MHAILPDATSRAPHPAPWFVPRAERSDADDEQRDEPTIMERTTFDGDRDTEVEGPEAMRPVLRVLVGVEAGQVFHLHGPTAVIGRREGADVVVPDEGVSRRHCLIAFDRDGMPVLSDLGSTNGTWLNHQRVGGVPRRLHDGDRIRLGRSVVLGFSLKHPLEAALEEKLYRSAVRDPLTGLHNRRYLLERLDQELAWAERHDRPLTVVFVDLDHFKAVNDGLGHEAGDAALRHVARVLARSVRAEDVVARYGGEEFVLLLRDTPLAHGAAMAERIRRALAARPVPHRGGAFPLTGSFGVASTAEDGITGAPELLALADRRLYQAKDAGRNRVAAGPATPRGPRGRPRGA